MSKIRASIGMKDFFVQKEKTFNKNTKNKNIDIKATGMEAQTVKMCDRDDSAKGESSKADISCLDVSSADFDPVAAIYSSDLSLPAPGAPVLDNVDAFISKMTVRSV